MTANRHNPLEERSLWLRACGSALRASPADRTARPSDLELAAYLDGAADEHVAARVESWLVNTESGVGELADLRQMLAARHGQLIDGDALPRIRARAMSLVTHESTVVQHSQPSAEAPIIFPWALRFPLVRRGLAAAAAIALCVAGYQAGMGASAVANNAASSSDLITEAVSFGMLTENDVIFEQAAWELVAMELDGPGR